MFRYPVSCLALSQSGRHLVTGEKAVMGVRAVVSCWDTRTWAVVSNNNNVFHQVVSID